ncbi:MAG: hypothetical protein FWG31_07915 [Oscillospiraceae bacterium]|nr:hypothetical protein [Oscillospiraceae bacterium]
MKHDLAAGTLDIPARFEVARAKFEAVVSKANTRVPVHNRGKEVTVRLKKQVMVSPEFLALWDKIKGRTAYRVAIDEDALKTRCIEKIAEMERLPKAQVTTRTARMNVEQSGVTHTEMGLSTMAVKEEAHRLRGVEKGKFKCGRRHFAALGDGVEFPDRPVKDWWEFKKTV